MDQPDRPGGYARQIEAFPDSSFDFILIDGEERSNCIRAAARKVRVGGWIVVDNADSQYDNSPLFNFECRQTSNGVSEGPSVYPSFLSCACNSSDLTAEHLVNAAWTALRHVKRRAATRAHDRIVAVLTLGDGGALDCDVNESW